tara:strand:- start:1404 stop:1622 length:219 start_codon:yes stop_codon:yes gene_type:complete
MKFLLTLTICSSVMGECMPPFKWHETFRTHYDCAMLGYEQAAKKTEEIGRKEVNEYGIVVSFTCKLIPGVNS